MLAELAAFNSAFATVKATVQAGRSLASAASAIAQMVDTKADLQTKLTKKKNSIFSSSTQHDLEEFLALEQIREAETQLREIMIYSGRAGLHQDFVKFQSEARKARQDAQKEAERKRRELQEKIEIGFGIFLFLLIMLGGAGLIYYLKEIR